MIQIKQDIGIPSTHIENTKDLPLEDRLTDSMAALKHFTISSYRALGIEESFYHLNEAIKLWVMSTIGSIPGTGPKEL